MQQLLEHCRDPEVARLIVNEFNCALREPTYVNFKNRLSMVFIEQFNYLDLESRKQRAVLNDYANQISNKYKPAIRHSAEQMINNLAAISEQMHLSSQERRTLQELSANERGALAKLREFLGRREHLEEQRFFVELEAICLLAVSMVLV